MTHYRFIQARLYNPQSQRASGWMSSASRQKLSRDLLLQYPPEKDRRVVVFSLSPHKNNQNSSIKNLCKRKFCSVFFGIWTQHMRSTFSPSKEILCSMSDSTSSKLWGRTSDILNCTMRCLYKKMCTAMNHCDLWKRNNLVPCYWVLSENIQPELSGSRL